MASCATNSGLLHCSEPVTSIYFQPQTAVLLYPLICVTLKYYSFYFLFFVSFYFLFFVTLMIGITFDLINFLLMHTGHACSVTDLLVVAS